MNLTITQPAFDSIASRAATVVDQRPTIPIIGCILLTATKAGRLTATGTDLAQYVSASVACDVDQPGSIAVPRTDLLSAIKVMPSGASIDVETDGKRVVLRAGKRRITLPFVDGEEFPTPRTVKAGAASVELPVAALAAALKRTLCALSADLTRTHLSSSFLAFEGGDTLRTSTTDGHRLAVVKQNVGKVSGGWPPHIGIAHDVVPALVSLCEEKNGPDVVTLACDEKTVSVTRGDASLVAALAEAEPPPVDLVIPKAHVTQTIVARAELTAAIRAVLTTSQDKDGFRGVVVEIHDRCIRLSASNNKSAEAADEIACAVEGKPIDFSVNGRYVLEILDAVASEDVVIETERELDPVVIKARGDTSGTTFLVMPARR